MEQIHAIAKMKWIIALLIAISFSVVPSHELTGQRERIHEWRREKHKLRSLNSTAANKQGSQQQIGIHTIAVKQDNEYLTESIASAGLSRNADFMSEGFPGQPKINISFAQYSGYVTVDAAGGRALFYYFAEAVSQPSKKPLILWFNGGPGCSSFGYGAMIELGPWRVNSDGRTLRYNPYSWITAANVLFVESPVGVGFSYSNTTADYATLGDTPTARDAYAFLVNWFQRFPEYKKRDFYVAGESYAGHYVPELTQTILAHQATGHARYIKLKGIMVGNGLIHDPTDDFGMYNYPWTHALISDNTYNGLIKHCINHLSAVLCDELEGTMNSETGNINPYSIYAPLCDSSHGSPSPASNAYLIPSYDPCVEDYTTTYLNRPEVQKALHANTTQLPQAWSLCSNIVTWNWTDSPESMLPLYRRFLKQKLKILVYSGDVDSVVPVTSTRLSLNVLKLKIIDNWAPWALRNGSEVGGYEVGYRGITFSTIRGAGHEVPLYQPIRMLALLNRFLKS